MIIKMAKVDILGPKDDLIPVLELLRGKGVFQPDPELLATKGRGGESFPLTDMVLTPDEVVERNVLLSLQDRVRSILELLPRCDISQELHSPLPAADFLDDLSTRHHVRLQELSARIQELTDRAEDLTRTLAFWKALLPLADDLPPSSNLALFGITIRREEDVARLEEGLRARLGGRCHISTAPMGDGSLAGLIATDRETEPVLRKLLDEVHVPEKEIAEELASLTFAQRVDKIKGEYDAVLRELQIALESRSHFASQWHDIYCRVDRWLAERLAVFGATAVAYSTRQCFVINGWMATEEIPSLQHELTEQFSGRVLVEKIEILEREEERVPVALRNPPIFAPFEIFSRLLPVPRYTSFDPTPFIAIFLPVFFGMILGDIAYGLIIVLLGAWLVKGKRFSPLFHDFGKVMGLGGLYAMVFGLLYGEFFGDFGEHYLLLHPLWFDRAKAMIPTAVFALSIGVMHILFGLLLRAWNSLRHHERREGIVRLLMVIIIVALLLSGVGFFVPLAWLEAGPYLTLVGLLVPLLIIFGGLLAPLELLKTIGNMVSYLRIMAVGFSSVLLAVVANRLGGLTGDLVTGILVAGLLHAFNLILGIFAPAVHSLRLHYVEFFSKFLEFGGRRFQPWGGNHRHH